MWKVTPTVFAVGREYQIMIPVECECIMKVEIGDNVYYDAFNGIMRSRSLVHKVTVPMEILDQAGAYTVHLQRVLDRKHKFAEMGECESKGFVFLPVCGEKIRTYHIADNHGLVSEAAEAAIAYGEIDFLILNGDLANNFSEESAVWKVYELTSAITGGNIPVVMVRGNHDTRGKYAELYAEYFPTRSGETYYTFRLGNIWGLALDCGEDKEDDHPEYGGLVCCHDFRVRETEYIRKVIAESQKEYAADDVVHRLVICHVPFTTHGQGIFDIEREIYGEWVKLLREDIKPRLVVSGHEHVWEVYETGSKKDSYGQCCPTLVGSALERSEGKAYFAGAGLEMSAEGIEITYTDCLGEKRTIKA